MEKQLLQLSALAYSRKQLSSKDLHRAILIAKYREFADLLDTIYTVIIHTLQYLVRSLVSVPILLSHDPALRLNYNGTAC